MSRRGGGGGGPPHSRSAGGGYHHDDMMALGQQDESWSMNSRGQPPPRQHRDERYSAPTESIHSRRSSGLLDEGNEEDAVDHNHDMDSGRYHPGHFRPGRSYSSGSQHSGSIHLAPVDNEMMRYAATQPDVWTSRAMERRTTSLAEVSRPPVPYMERNLSGISVDSTVRRAQESMQSFQRTNESAINRLVPEEIPPPSCPAKPREPKVPLRTSRRCLERVRLEQHQVSTGQSRPSPQTTFVVGLLRSQNQYTRQQDLLASSPHQFMAVTCESCQDELIVPKTAVVVECPKCHKVGAASSRQRTPVTAS